MVVVLKMTDQYNDIKEYRENNQLNYSINALF